MNDSRHLLWSRGLIRQAQRNKKRTGWIAAAALALVVGLSGCAAVSATTTPSTTSSATASVAAPGKASGGGSNARSGPAAGGSSGTITSTSTSGFTLSTSAGQKVTITTSSATTYEKGANSTTASAVAINASVLVLGTTNGTTIAASQVIVQPASGSAPTAYAASAVAPFKQGAPSTAKQDSSIPANYTEGSGTIVSGTTANKATEAALAAYPGGIVDRVVQLSNGEYEVHYIGVNWPHHIFVNQDFTVVGAD
ncbi:MAG TPA: hypothetical protein VIJ18_14695 [Microbacteriaceae bacterium]